MISRITRACTSGVTTGAGEYAPMPPVFGPWSPSQQALVVLAGRERQHVRAVAHDDEARFLAFEEFLDHDARAGVAAACCRRASMSIAACASSARRRDDHALAGGEAVGLDDDRRAALRRRTRAPRPRR